MLEVKGGDIYFNIVNIWFILTIMDVDNNFELKIYLDKRDKDWSLVHPTT